MNGAVYVGELSPRAVKIDKRFGLFAVYVYAVQNRFLFIVVPLIEFAAAVVADALFFRRQREHVEVRSAFFADAPRRKALDDFFIFDNEIDDPYVVADFRKRFGLCEGTRKSVEDKAALRVVRFEPFFYERARDIVAYQTARVDDTFDRVPFDF